MRGRRGSGGRERSAFCENCNFECTNERKSRACACVKGREDAEERDEKGEARGSLSLFSGRMEGKRETRLCVSECLF